jgi:hypothetical protein
MKNFLDLLDINPTIEVKIVLTPVTDNGFPTAIIRYNNVIVSNYNLKETATTIIENLNILDPFKISIELAHKTYDEKLETAIIINSLTIDNFEIVPNYTQLAAYINDHNNTNPTNYLGFNGIWELDIPMPFYQWLHGVQGQGWLIE